MELANYLRSKIERSLHNETANVIRRLQEAGYLSRWHPDTGKTEAARKRPREHVGEYRAISRLIEARDFDEAIRKYYELLGHRPYGELHHELIYLKRLAKHALGGRDILFFKAEASRGDLIRDNLGEYVDCIDETLRQREQAGVEVPLDIIHTNAPTMEELVEERARAASVEGVKHSTPYTPTLRSFSASLDGCPEGRLFERYPDQVWHCRAIERSTDRRNCGLWTTTPPAYIENEILNKGLYVRWIMACKMKAWKRSRRTPDFTTALRLDEIVEGRYGTIRASGVKYSGRSHIIEGTKFYEIDLPGYPKYLGNPFTECIDEILREAENLLRERHGLPRIGEGWVSEVQLYKLLKGYFPDAELHASPTWLRPQHLDVFVASARLAFEYQGQQHFGPVDFFGGEDAFHETVRRDKRKARMCKANKIALVTWRFEDQISEEVLFRKLGEIGINMPSP